MEVGHRQNLQRAGRRRGGGEGRHHRGRCQHETAGDGGDATSGATAQTGQTQTSTTTDQTTQTAAATDSSGTQSDTGARAQPPSGGGPGAAFAGDLVTLFVFWELTSITSFLLIGYWHHREDARRGARMALTVTGTGGLCLLAGMLILGHIVGSYDLDQVLAAGEIGRAHV